MRYFNRVWGVAVSLLFITVFVKSGIEFNDTNNLIVLAIVIILIESGSIQDKLNK